MMRSVAFLILLFSVLWFFACNALRQEPSTARLAAGFAPKEQP